MSLRVGGTVYSSSISLMMKDWISAIEEGILSTLATTSVLMRPRLTIPGIPKRRNLVWALSFSWVLILTPGSAKIPEVSIRYRYCTGISQVSIVSIRIDTLSILTPKNYLFTLLFYLYKNIFICNSFNF